MNKSELKQIIKEEIHNIFNEIKINKPGTKIPINGNRWESLGEDFKYDEEDNLYFYYKILFFNDTEDSMLRAEIQFNDYSKSELKLLNKKLELLEEILDKNNYEYNVRSQSWKIDFEIYY